MAEHIAIYTDQAYLHRLFIRRDLYWIIIKCLIPGVIYEGEFEDGMFHGKGDLKYPSGDIVRGTWKNGQLVERKLIFADGLEFSETDWMYCRMPDRR